MVSELWNIGRLTALRKIIDEEILKLLDDSSKNGHAEVSELARHIIMAGGKRMRPLLILLCYELAGGENIEEIMPLAVAFEMIHSATLIHDDINDNAKLRRGVPTIHEKAGPVKAQITGDWLFVQGFGLGGIYDERIVKIMADCCAKIASAELDQYKHIHDISTTPEDYFKIIEGKTAGPFSSGCEASAIVAKSNSKQISLMREFGLQVGVAFQIVDDLLDLIGDERTGKPRGSDILEGKMTLPLIHSLTMLQGPKRKRMEEMILKFNMTHWEELITMLESAGSIEYAKHLIDSHLDRALTILEEFPETNARKLIAEITQYVRERHD